jgi:glycosyltransferase involved in cell wall biosynthesis
MTADTLGGVWNYALELARALQPYGTEITLMTMGARLSREQWQDVSHLQNIQWIETDFRLEWMDDPWRDVDAAGERLLELEASVAPDIVHLNGYAHGSLAWHSPVLMVAHSCVLSWWQAVHREAAPLRYRQYQERVSDGLQSAGMVVAPTQAMLSSLAENYQFSGPAKVIFNGTRDHGVAAETKEPFVMAAGRLWDEAKNFTILNRLAPRLKWPIRIAGDPGHPNGSRRNFENLVCCGLLSSEMLAGALKRASIYAHPALYEPFGLSVLEAAFSGCALVLGDIPSLREVWENAAVFVSPQDEYAIERGISRLIDSPALLREMGGRARQAALRYSTATMAANYVATYSELMESRLHKEVAR